MKRYDSYKDSGVEWIGEVPSHWEIIRMKYTCDFNGRIGFRGYSQADLVSEGEGAITLSPTNMNDIYVDYNKCSYLSWEKYYESPEIMVKQGDVLLVKTASVGKCSFVNTIPMECTVNPQILVLKKHRQNPMFLTYLFQIPIGQTYIDLYKAGSTIYTLSEDKIGNFRFVFPNKKEQDIIVSYLDSKCGEVDKVISTQEKRIALLQELKQSIITHAVTKGLNPNVKMKDSGIEWIGEVPEHWEVYKTSLAFNKIGSGTTPKSSEKSYYDDDGYYWLQTGDLNDGNIIDTSKKITKKAVVECKMKFYPKGSIVIAMYGATIGKLGLLHINTSTNQACCVLCPSKKIYNTFAFYIYKSAKQEMLIDAMGGGQPNISQDIIRLLRIPVPPLAEQQEIASYLDKRCASIDASISKAQREIELLQEYKQSLITEVVTGKRKVC